MAASRKHLMNLGLAALTLLALGACREEEQGRQLLYQPGTYLGGNPDRALSEEQAARLRLRLRPQAGSAL